MGPGISRCRRLVGARPPRYPGISSWGLDQSSCWRIVRGRRRPLGAVCILSYPEVPLQPLSGFVID